MTDAIEFAGLCSDADLSVSDDLAGTASSFNRFLILEQRGSFGRHAADDALLALDPNGQPILDYPGLVVLAVRPVGRADGRGVRTRYLGSADNQPFLREIDEVPSLPDLVDAVGTAAERAAPPLIGICTNGSRDRCCALKGRDLAAAVSVALDGPDGSTPDDEATVVEISHLGGHRFAPTMIVLPSGYTYGRLDVDTAIEIAAAAQDGLIDPRLLRGRVSLLPAAQVADARWRQELGEPSPLAAVQILECTEHDGSTTVSAIVDGASRELRLRAESGPRIDTTWCGGKPFDTQHWLIDDSRRTAIVPMVG